MIAALTFCACGGGGDDNNGSEVLNLSVTPSEVVIAAEGGTSQVSVNASAAWTAFAADGTSWLTVQAQGQAGTSTFEVRAKENLTYDAREAQVTVKSGTERKYITVKQPGATKPSIECPIAGYTLVWNDEFDEDGILTGDWTYEVQGSGWVNNELQNYVSQQTPGGTNVAECKNGILSIRCVKEGGKIYSARLYGHRKDGFRYCYIEASICLPKGKGTWPAFWMMPVNFKAWPDDGEIDIMEEVGYHPNYVSSSLHAISHVHSNNTQVTHEMLCQGAEGEFHTYGMEWTAKYIQTYVDGKPQLRYEDTGKGKNDWPYNTPFYPILNLAWGGSWGGAQGVDESALPATMKVDWIRVYQK